MRYGKTASISGVVASQRWGNERFLMGWCGWFGGLVFCAMGNIMDMERKRSYDDDVDVEDEGGLDMGYYERCPLQLPLHTQQNQWMKRVYI